MQLTRYAGALSLGLLMFSSVASAVDITLPPSGDNQRSTVTQGVGAVKVTVDYSSPRVNRTDAGDRRGKIWGKLVPYGLADLGFGSCKECPWRAGANENTTFTFSHDVRVEGQPLAAGTYAFFMIPAADGDWTAIFSKDNTAWGSFFYDPAHDALRVKVKPSKSEYHEFLTYDFTDREPASATVALKWEELQLPLTIAVDDVANVYLSTIRKELLGSKGFDAKNFDAAAGYVLDSKKDPVEALKWAKMANSGVLGPEDYQTLMTLARAELANGLTADAGKTREKALNHPTATPIALHQYARQQLTEGNKAEALRVWQLNQKRFGDAWPINVGLARGYSASGNYKDALKYARLALKQAPDELNRKNIEGAITKLEAGKDMN